MVRIIHSVAKGISSINSVGYAHRDIKIENVLIGNDGNYKLCDFGSCSNKVLDFGVISPSDYGHYQDELEKNTTPMYRPPEIVDPFRRYKIDTKVPDRDYVGGCMDAGVRTLHDRLLYASFPLGY